MKGSFSVTVRPVSSLDDIIQGVEQTVRIRAYERYVERGRQPGREIEDWQNATGELLRQPHANVSESEFQTTVEVFATEEEVRDSELLVSEQTLLLIGRNASGTGSVSKARTFKLIAFSRPVDNHSLRADYTNGRLYCTANAAKVSLKASA